MKRKKATTATGAVSINAAPGSGDVDEDGDEVRPKKVDSGGLMGKLNGVLGDLRREERKKPAARGGDDDYQKFLEGLGDLA